MRTVEWHLLEISAKLGIGSRAARRAEHLGLARPAA
jgi:hypothetical protein